MKRELPEDIPESLLDAYLDGALDPSEEERVQNWLRESPRALHTLEQEAALGAALRQLFSRGRQRPWGLGGSLEPLSRWRVAAACAAAMFVLAAGFLAGRLTVAEPALKVPGGLGVLDRAGLQADARAVLLHDGAGGALVLEQGGLRMVAGPGVEPVEPVELEGASIRGEGDVELFRLPATAALSGAGMVAVHGGRALLTTPEGRLVLQAGELAVIRKGVVMDLRQALGSQPPAGESVIATEPFRPNEEDPELLQNRVAELLSQNRSLKLEVEALRMGRGKAVKLSLKELMEALARIVENEKGERKERREFYGSMRELMRRTKEDPAQALEAVEQALLAPKASLQRRSLGLRLLGMIGTPEALELLKPYVRDPNRNLKRLAMQSLARRKHPDLQAFFEKALTRQEEDLVVRIRAAGGLLLLGQADLALPFLENAWREHRADPTLGRLIMSPVLEAPLERVGDFLIEMAESPNLRGWRLRVMLDHLVRVGGPEAERILVALTEVLKPEGLKARAQKALERLRKRSQDNPK